MVLVIIVSLSHNLSSFENIYLGSDNEPADLSVMASWVMEKRGLKNEELKFLTRIKFTKTESNKRCSNKKLKETGYKFLFPTFREGYNSIIE